MYNMWSRKYLVGRKCVYWTRFYNVCSFDKIAYKEKLFYRSTSVFSTGNHYSKLGKFLALTTDEDKKNDGVKQNHDVLVEEDVWIGANVSVLCEHIGEGLFALVVLF